MNAHIMRHSVPTPQTRALRQQNTDQSSRSLHFSIKDSIVVQPLAPVDGTPPDATRDPCESDDP